MSGRLARGAVDEGISGTEWGEITDKPSRLFLGEFSRPHEREVYAALIWDGARFDRSGELETPSNVSLICLPTYSLGSNPIENLWHDLRAHLRKGK